MKMRKLDWSVSACRRCLSPARCEALNCGRGVLRWLGPTAWWELFLSDRGGISPLPPSGMHGVRSDALEQLVWKNRTNTSVMHVDLKLQRKFAKWFWKKRWSRDPDFWAEKDLALLLWIHKTAGGVFACMQKQADLYGKKWSHFHSFVCLSLFSSLWSALARSCSFSLLSGNQTSVLHRSACHPFFIQPPTKNASICTFLLHTPSLPVCQCTVNPPPALHRTKKP